jgi:hypothetical protein
MIGYAGETDRAEQDRVAVGEAVQPVRRHHGAVLGVPLAGPRVLGDVHRERPGHLRHVREHGEGSRNDLPADPVAGQDGEPVRGHGESSGMATAPKIAPAAGLADAAR